MSSFIYFFQLTKISLNKFEQVILGNHMTQEHDPSQGQMSPSYLLFEVPLLLILFHALSTECELTNFNLLNFQLVEVFISIDLNDWVNHVRNIDFPLCLVQILAFSYFSTFTMLYAQINLALLVLSPSPFLLEFCLQLLNSQRFCFHLLNSLSNNICLPFLAIISSRKCALCSSTTAQTILSCYNGC